MSNYYYVLIFRDNNSYTQILSKQTGAALQDLIFAYNLYYVKQPLQQLGF
jgi:hypothetical protein